MVLLVLSFTLLSQVKAMRSLSWYCRVDSSVVDCRCSPGTSLRLGGPIFGNNFLRAVFKINHLQYGEIIYKKFFSMVFRVMTGEQGIRTLKLKWKTLWSRARVAWQIELEVKQ